jgi:integrase
MPNSRQQVPTYRRRRGRRYSSGKIESDQAVVTLAGVNYYLGPFGTKASRAQYDRLIAEWLASGRQKPAASRLSYQVVQLCDVYWTFAKAYYQKDGRCTGVCPAIKCALRYVLQWYAEAPVDEFGPLALKAVRQQMIADGHSRKYINDHVDRIKRMFKWGVAEELVSAETYQRLATVTGLRKGRSEARETVPIRPVGTNIIQATLPSLPAVVADMVRLQRLCGCRPNEICIMKPSEIDRSQDVWIYTPSSHKTDSLRTERNIFIGPRAQAILRPYLERDPAAFCFQPIESEAARNRNRHAHRRTPMNQGNRPGRGKRRRLRPSGDHYTADSYRRAIHRACDRAFEPPIHLRQQDGETELKWLDRLSQSQRIELRNWQRDHRWSPNQLRHAAATEVRKEFGLEAAQIVLGHAAADVTQIYAERDIAKGFHVARAIG